MIPNTERVAANESGKNVRVSPSHIFLALVTLLILAACAYAGYYSWLVMTDNIGSFHKSTGLADLDGDGDLDVLLHNLRREAEFTAFSVTTLWFNQGNGRFVARHLGQSTDGGGWDAAAGDVDQDGDIDLVLFMGYQLRLFLNQGGAQRGEAGQFAGSQSIAGPERNGQYGSILLGDLNDDDQVDGVVVGCCGRLFTLDPDADAPNVSGVWINEGDRPGHISLLSALDGLAMSEAALGDLDGDGDRDIFAAVIAPSEGQNRNPADRVIFNDGDGNFSDSGQRLGEKDSTAVALGDLDGDGDSDALVGHEQGVTIWLNQGGRQGGWEGTFALAEQTISGDQTKALFLADLDGDGDRDALVAGYRQAILWWNDGHGTFMRSGRRFRYSKRHGLAVGDFNGDGRSDIFAAAYGRDYRVWLNQGDGTFQAAP